MIQFIRTASVLPGRMPAAIRYALELAAHIEQHHNERVEVSIPLAGKVGRIKWRTEHRDLAELDRRLASMRGDPQMARFQRMAADLFVPGMTEDHIWSTVEAPRAERKKGEKPRRKRGR